MSSRYLPAPNSLPAGLHLAASATPPQAFLSWFLSAKTEASNAFSYLSNIN